MNIIKKTLMNTGLATLLLGTTTMYSCNNTNDVDKQNIENIIDIVDIKPDSVVHKTDSTYLNFIPGVVDDTTEFEFTADFIGNFDAVASKDEKEHLRSWMLLAGMEGRKNIYVGFKEDSCDMYVIDLITVSDTVPSPTDFQKDSNGNYTYCMVSDFWCGKNSPDRNLDTTENAKNNINSELYSRLTKVSKQWLKNKDDMYGLLRINQKGKFMGKYELDENTFKMRFDMTNPSKPL